MNTEQCIQVLERQVFALRTQAQALEEFVDTVTSPLWKRIWWWFGGYYFRKVGRWYPETSLVFRIWLVIARRIECE